MNSLLSSGNLFGIIGLGLMMWTGVQLIRGGHRGGWLLSVGAALVCFSLVFQLYLEPLLVNPIHLTFGHGLIALITMTPTMTLTLGFLLIPLGLLMVAAQQQKQQKLAPVVRR